MMNSLVGRVLAAGCNRACKLTVARLRLNCSQSPNLSDCHWEEKSVG